ncbi:MAG: class II aldolase/adducin family protein [Nocardioides sp.]|nr:class II aldolase/adducin family protein [Nocardioides sp.]
MITDPERTDTPSSARETARVAVAAASRRLAVDGLLIGTAGNVSMVVAGTDGTEIAVTATGIHLASATPDQVSIVDPGGVLLDGELVPTSELELHLGAYASHGAGAVVHTHSPAATAISLVVDELPCVHYQQLLLGGSIRVAPFAVFGSAELATRVREALAGRQAAILANHGTLVVGTDLDAAVDNAHLLEWLADLYLRAGAIGPPRTLSEAQQQGVIEAALATGYGTPRKAGS